MEAIALPRNVFHCASRISHTRLRLIPADLIQRNTDGNPIHHEVHRRVAFIKNESMQL
jgi:hypothetical protein